MSAAPERIPVLIRRLEKVRTSKAAVRSTGEGVTTVIKRVVKVESLRAVQAA